MYIKVERPEQQVSGEDIDRYLADGWYRTGQVWMTCRIVWFEGDLYSAIWTRLNLADHQMKRSHRKLLAKIKRNFRIEHGPAIPDARREAIYQRYRQAVSGSRWVSLASLLGISRPEATDRYPTEELALYDQDQLVAFSWFDRGSEGLESLAGVYDPNFEKMSLGFATLLLEIEFAKEQGLSYHYPGYLLPGAPQMEYKRRMGPLEHYDADRKIWLPDPDRDPDTLPLARLRTALGKVANVIRNQGKLPYPVIYKAFEATAYNPGLSRCLQHPVAIGAGGKGGPFVKLIVWDITTGHYSLVHCQHAMAVRRSAEGKEETDPDTPLLVVTEHTPLSDDPNHAAEALLAR